MRIIVLAGGLSTERDVSLSSGAGICRTLREKGHDAFLLDPFLGLPDAGDNLEAAFHKTWMRGFPLHQASVLQSRIWKRRKLPEKTNPTAFSEPMSSNFAVSRISYSWELHGDVKVKRKASGCL